MSSDGSRAAETEALSSNVEVIERETAALAAALGRARKTRLCLLVALLAMIVINCGALYRLGQHFRSQENMALLKETAKKQVRLRRDRFLREIKALADHSTPVLRKAFEAQLAEDMRRYEEGLKRERAALLGNLQEQLEKKVQEHQRRNLAQHESILKEEFPQFDDQEARGRMIDNMQIAMRPLIRKFYVDRLRGQVEEMYKTWDQFPAAEPFKEGDPPPDVVLAGRLLELLTIKMATRPERESLKKKMRGRPKAPENDNTEAGKKDESGR